IRTGFELIRDHATPGDRLERHGADKARRGRRHDGNHVVAPLLQTTCDFDGLVGADSAGHPECDQHDCWLQASGFSVLSRSIASTAFVIPSSWATVVFLGSPTSTRGVDPFRSWRARAPAVTTNSKELGNLLRSIMKSPDNAFCDAGHPAQARPFGQH